MKKSTPNLTRYTDPHRTRRGAVEVAIGGVRIGGANPLAVQTMTDVDTLDTAACIAQIGRIREAGCRIVRLTTQGAREAENLAEIRRGLVEKGWGDVALVADVHFNPEVAAAAAQYADKVRINPGNYRDQGGEFDRLVDKCRERGISLRIGVNHGSLSERIVEKLGDTPAGMVESAMEMLRRCKAAGFDAVVVSMKSSNIRVMVQAYRLLAGTMEKEGMNYPLHLGVTEAGDGLDGRIKSAAGIAALLCDGIGDTVRVSLSEPPENEIPFALALVDYMAEGALEEDMLENVAEVVGWSPFEYRPRETAAVGNIGGGNPPRLFGELDGKAQAGVENLSVALLCSLLPDSAREWRAQILNMEAAGDRRPVVLYKRYHEDSAETLAMKAAADMGPVFIDGLAQGLWIDNAGGVAQEEIDRIALSILQAARVRISAPEYIACPGCGRTQFDLRRVLAAVRERTSHLAGLKIAVMGCIVNGPGEMADADYGYVGAGKGRVTLYNGREAVRHAIPEDEAVEALVALIKENGDWRDA